MDKKAIASQRARLVTKGFEFEQVNHAIGEAIVEEVGLKMDWFFKTLQNT